MSTTNEGRRFRQGAAVVLSGPAELVRFGVLLSGVVCAGVVLGGDDLLGRAFARRLRSVPGCCWQRRRALVGGWVGGRVAVCIRGFLAATTAVGGWVAWSGAVRVGAVLGSDGGVGGWSGSRGRVRFAPGSFLGSDDGRRWVAGSRGPAVELRKISRKNSRIPFQRWDLGPKVSVAAPRFRSWTRAPHSRRGRDSCCRTSSPGGGEQGSCRAACSRRGVGAGPPGRRPRRGGDGAGRARPGHRDPDRRRRLLRWSRGSRSPSSPPPWASGGSGRRLVGEALELACRLPRIWARVRAGSLPAWRARRIAEETLALSAEAAEYVEPSWRAFAHKTGSGADPAAGR